MKRAARPSGTPPPNKRARLAKAEVGKLYLIHYPTGRFAKGDIAAEASKTYKGEVIVAKDFMTIDI